LLWRTLGWYTESGAWVAPVSFVEAQNMPKKMLKTFLTLDDVLSRMERQVIAKKNKSAGRTRGR
jgi:hypothetical protein